MLSSFLATSKKPRILSSVPLFSVSTIILQAASLVTDLMIRHLMLSLLVHFQVCVGFTRGGGGGGGIGLCSVFDMFVEPSEFSLLKFYLHSDPVNL